MAFTYGFYNSSNHDRKYDAKQMGQFFDGLITDGVYSTVGDRFYPKVSSTANTVIIGSGRAWFNHTWNYNDSDLPMTGHGASSAYNRYDAIVIDIKSSSNYRQNSILYVTGIASSSPAKPTLVHTNDHNQYPICYIYRRAGSTTIIESDIEYVVGTDECPYVESSMIDTKNIAQVESNDKASKTYSSGEYILWHGELYKTVSSITKGIALIAYPSSGYNITRTTIANELSASITLDSVVTSSSQHGVTSAGIYAALGNRTKIETSSPTSGSSNLITSGQVYTALGGKSSISTTSSVTSGSSSLITSGGVYAALGNRSSLSTTSSVTSGSSSLITSGGVYNALGGRSSISTTSSVTSGSSSLITSGGVYTALSSKMDTSNIQSSTTDLTAGSSSLTTGKIYMVYE